MSTTNKTTRRPKKDDRSRTRRELTKLRAAVPVLEAEIVRQSAEIVELKKTNSQLEAQLKEAAKARDEHAAKLNHLRSMGVNVDNYGN